MLWIEDGPVPWAECRAKGGMKATDMMEEPASEMDWGTEEGMGQHQKPKPCNKAKDSNRIAALQVSNLV